jgi:hypothetical protein
MTSRLDWINGSGGSNIDSVLAVRMVANAGSKSPGLETSTTWICIPRATACARIRFDELRNGFVARIDKEGDAAQARSRLLEKAAAACWRIRYRGSSRP